jgi:hypothetical protein
MDEASRPAFAAAWLDPKNNKRLGYIASVYSADIDLPADFRQRCFMRLWIADEVWPANGNVCHRAENEMRHMRTDMLRSHDLKKTDRNNGDNDETVPISGRPEDPEQMNAMKQRAARILAKLEQKLDRSVPARRALEVVRLALDGVNDMRVLTAKLNATTPQIYEARRLGFDTLEAIMAREDEKAATA